MRRAFALLVLLLCACSREGGPPPAGSTPNPGLLPLAVQQSRFCREGRRLGSAASAGFCVPLADSHRACLACAANEDCLCGRCTFTACGSSLDCPSGRRCRRGRCDPSCAGDADCPTGRACVGGACLTPCTGGCAPGERCESGHCEAVACRRDGDCGADERCDLSREQAFLREPSVVRKAGVFLLALEERLPGGSRIVLARSSDGLAWDLDPGAALEASLAWEAGAVRAPALLDTAAGLRLYYEGGDGAGIGLASEGEAGRFLPDETPVLVAEAAWEEGRVGGPAPADDGATLFYDAGRVPPGPGGTCTGDGDCAGPLQRCRAGQCRPVPRVLGVARQGSGGWIRQQLLQAADVVAASANRQTGEPLWGEVSAVFSPGVVRCPTCSASLTLLFFTGVGSESPGSAGETAALPTNRSIGLAVSRDGLTFPPYAFNPVLARLALFTDPLQESGAWPVSVDGGVVLYFDVVGDAPGVAISPGARIPTGGE